MRIMECFYHNLNRSLGNSLLWSPFHRKKTVIQAVGKSPEETFVALKCDKAETDTGPAGQPSLSQGQRMKNQIFRDASFSEMQVLSEMQVFLRCKYVFRVKMCLFIFFAAAAGIVKGITNKYNNGLSTNWQRTDAKNMQ